MQLPAGIRSQCTGYFKRDAAVQEHHSGKCVPDRSAGGLSKNLKTYVKDYGCGLVACGGEDSFALGGYLDTELEKLLPVDMQLRGVNEKQNLAMVMVIDHSGSMSEQTEGGTNLDLAIAAAKAAVDQLDTKDEVGVVTFDDGYTWQVPLEKVKDKDKIHQSIETISEGGGTTIKPAVRAALNEIKKSKAQLKHIVLLTDGQGKPEILKISSRTARMPM